MKNWSELDEGRKVTEGMKGKLPLFMQNQLGRTLSDGDI